MSENAGDETEERLAHELAARWDLPPEVVKKSFTYQSMLLAERFRELARAIRDALPGPLRRRHR